MNLNKKRRKKLWGVIVLSVVVLILAICVDIFVQDEYVVGWLVSVSQGLLVFAIFRFRCVKERQKKSKLVWKITSVVFVCGVLLTLIGVIIPIVLPNFSNTWIVRIGSYIAGLGINGYVCYLANEFDIIEAIEDHNAKREHKRNYRHKVAAIKSK